MDLTNLNVLYIYSDANDPDQDYESQLNTGTDIMEKNPAYVPIELTHNPTCTYVNL